MADRPPLSPAALRLLAGRFERQTRRRFLEAIGRIQQRLPIGAIERALVAQNIDLAIDLVGLEPVVDALHEIGRSLATMRGESFRTALSDIPAAARRGPLVSVSLDRYLGEHLMLAQAVAAENLRRIQELRRETEQALRETIQRGIAAGRTPRDLARLIEPHIGLNRRQAAALEKFRQQLLSEPRTANQVQRMVEREARRKLRRRAESIAITETMTALNQGKRLQHEKLVADGTINREDWEREWVTAEDSLVCKHCEDFSGTRAPIGGAFTSRSGRVEIGPPIHPNDRCIERLQLRGFRVTERPRFGLRPPPSDNPSTDTASTTATPPRASRHPARVLSEAEQTDAEETRSEQTSRLQFERKWWKGAAHEHGMAIFADGRMVRHSSRQPDHIDWRKYDPVLPQARLVNHNHRSGGSFSEEDVGFGLHYAVGIQRAFGAAPDGQRVSYEMQLRGLVGQSYHGHLITPDLLETEHYGVSLDLKPVHAARFRLLLERGVPEAEAQQRIIYEGTHEIMLELARRMGFPYRRRVG